MEEGGSSSSAQSSSKEPIPSAPTILLHILSPSPEVRTKLIFPDLPISTTVAELKTKICDAVATRPSPDRQRLIYRGRALVQEGATLKEIFSQETISQSEALSLHLVLPPAGPTQPSRSPQPSATLNPAANQNFPRSVSGPADLRPNHQDTAQIASAQGTSTSGNLSHAQPIAPHIHPQPNAPYVHPQYGPFPPLPAQLPLHLQQAMRSHFEALNQQLGTQNPSNGNAIPQGAPQNQFASHPANQPAVMLPNFHQIIAQQQQARAAAGLRGLGNDDRNQNTQTRSASPMPNQAPSAMTGNLAAAGIPANSRIVQENHGPNGEHWRMVIESTQTVTHPPHHHHGLPNNHVQRQAGLSNPNSRTSTPIISRTGTPQAVGASAAPSASHVNPRLGVVQSQQSILEQSLSSIEAALAAGTAPSEPVVESARMLLHRLSNEPDISANTLNTFRSRLDSLSTQADHLRASLNSILMRVISEQGPSQRLPTPSNAVYLLSSPNGPYALLVSPSGMYTTPWQLPGVAGAYPNTMHLQPSHVPSSTQPINRSTEPNVQNPPPNPVQAAQEPQEQQQQQQQQEEQQANQIRDLIRILLPLGGHIWLLVRLFGFVYFFTGGGGHRRAILLGLCAFLVFIAQTGVFRPFLQSAWEPFRRHIENLLPLANNDRRLLPDAAIAENNPNPAQATRHQHNVPTPQQAAERLLREREQRDGSVMRQYLRRAERAIALFIASLVPGVGERHIAARDAAEAARREEESEREREREEREREEREREEGRERNERANQEDSEKTAREIRGDGEAHESDQEERDRKKRRL